MIGVLINNRWDETTATTAIATATNVVERNDKFY